MPEVKLKGSVTDLQTVPESHRALYTKVGEAFVLGEVTLEDTTGLKNTVTATRAERDKAVADAKKFEGVDLEAYNTWVADKDNQAAADAKKKGDWDAREAQIKKTNDAALKAKDDALARTNQALHNQMIEAGARAALATAGGNELFLLPHVTPSLKIVEENGTFSARVIDAAGGVRVNSAGNPMSIDERVAELKADTKFAGAFAASGSGGTGSPAGGAGAGRAGAGQKTIKRADFEKMSPAQQMNFSTTEKGTLVD